MSIWDDPELNSSSDFIKFDTEGTTVIGTVTSVSMHTFDDGSRVPKLTLTTKDGDKTLTAGQAQLKALLKEKRPEAGDTITITYVRSEKRAGGKPLKHFTVDVAKGGATAPAAASTATDTDPMIAALAAKAGVDPALLAQLGAKQVG